MDFFSHTPARPLVAEFSELQPLEPLDGRGDDVCVWATVGTVRQNSNTAGMNTIMCSHTAAGMNT